MRNSRGLIGSLIGLAAGCGLTGGEVGDPSEDLRVDQIEVATDGTPYFMSGALGRVTQIDDASRAQSAVAGALPAIAAQLGVPAADLVATRAERDELGMTHVSLAQQKNGLRVVGGDGAVRSVNSSARDRELPSIPSIAADEAAQLAVKATADAASAARNELVYVVSNRDGELYLAWEVAVRGNEGAFVSDLVYVDALDGRIVDVHPQLFTIKNRVITNGNKGVFPVAGAPTIGTETTPPTDLVARAAFDNTGLTYDCYKTLYNRDSYDGLGATLTSQVHVVFQVSATQTTANNAVWASDVKMMAYGDGDGVQMKQLAYALDVTAHELTHAVTSATANLVYANESGALNEGMSDIMGAVCEAWKDKAISANTWLVGEEIYTPNTPGDALRYMTNPTKDNYSADYYPERLTGTADNGGVHGNSGIANLAFYLLSAGGKHPRARTTYTNAGIGIDKAGAIFQRALTLKYLTANSTFVAARTATEQAAQELYPSSCAKTAVSLAWASVGVGTAVPADTTPPTAAISAPTSGAKVAAGFQVQVNASDNQCVSKVELRIDGGEPQTVTAAPYIFTTDSGVTSGSHTLEVKTYDAFGLTGTATSTVTVSGGGTGTGGGGGAGGGAGASDQDVTGGCSAGGNGAAGSLALMFATVFALRRRRARR